MTAVISTGRLVLRPWSQADAGDALRIYRDAAVAAWLPADIPSVADENAMRSVIRGWLDEDQGSPTPAGHWAVELEAEHRLIGGCSLLFGAPGPESLKLRCMLSPTAWGRGYATEAGDALIRWAMHEGGVYEVYAVVQHDNARAAATAIRMGMEWVGETGLEAGRKLQVYRIRHGDLAYRDTSSFEAAPVTDGGLRTGDGGEAPPSPAPGSPSDP